MLKTINFQLMVKHMIGIVRVTGKELLFDNYVIILCYVVVSNFVKPYLMSMEHFCASSEIKKKGNMENIFCMLTAEHRDEDNELTKL